MHQTKMKELDDSSLQVMIFLAVSLCAKAMALFLPGKTSAQAGFCQCCSEAFGAAVPGGSHACRHHLAEDPGSVTVASVRDVVGLWIPPRSLKLAKMLLMAMVRRHNKKLVQP